MLKSNLTRKTVTPQVKNRVCLSFQGYAQSIGYTVHIVKIGHHLVDVKDISIAKT